MGLLTVGDFLGCILPANFTQTSQELVREVIGDLSMVDHDSSAAVTMETSKPESVSAPLHSSSVAAPTWRNMDMQTPLTHNKMDIQTPLTALYIHTVPAAHTQPQPYPPLPAAPQGPATFHLSVLPLNPKETLPLLTLHIAGGPQGLNPAAHPLPAVRPKSAGKHVCPHCGRDCMKPSVLEKHLRCHTGERPYPCATCGVSFKTQSNLYKHKRTQAHARLWSESEHSSLGSQDSVCSSTCGSSLSLDGCSDESGSVERDVSVTCCDSTMQLSPGKRRGTETGWALKTDPVNDNKELSTVFLNVMPNECQSTTTAKEKQTRTEHPNAPPTTNRHLPLQRQEATLFSKQWESSVSRGKSQSHDSTDSGFSESSDQYPSPIGVLHDHSMESLTESTLEDLEQLGGLKTSAKSGQEAGSGMSERGHRTLEERISKLISENSAVVEDKRLENARPRKTVLSKQGSIDLPLPYTYKDSFHFDMRNSKDRKVMLDSNRKPGSYGSVPTQRSTSVEHAPLTRSSSLPYNVTLLQPEMSSPTSSACRRDYDTIARRGSFGPIDAAGFAIKSVDQHVSTHHPLVRQAAVDCHHATEEEPSASNCDRDSSDACKEPSNRKWRRKKAAKFAYNKWYMYGAGTFKKLYNTEKGSDNVALKAKRLPVNPEHEVVHGVQRRSLTVHKEPAAIKDFKLNSPNGSATVCHPSSLPVNLNHKAKQPPSLCTSLKSALLRNTSTLQFPSFHSTDSIIPTESERSVNKESLPDSVSQQWVAHIPSDRKKQRTDVKATSRLGTETEPNTSTHAFHSVTGTVPEQLTDPSPINSQTIPYFKGIVSAPCIASRKHLNTSSAISIHPTSFLPKYQLKLPNPAGANTNPLPHTLNVLTVNNVSASDLSSSHMDQTSLSIMTLASQEKKHMDPRVPLLLHSHSIERINSSESIQDNASVFPTASLAVTSAARLNHSTACTFTVVHRRCTTITTTTASVQNRHAKLGTTSVQSSPSGAAAGSAPKQFARPPAMATESAFAPSTTTTGQNPPSAVTVTASSGGQHPPVSHTSHSSTLSGQRTPTETETPVVACQLVRFDSAQPSAENVFHVHTPDLQICLQIISDEQLALIEPQIEREGRVAETTGLSHKNCEGMDPQVMCNYLQSSVTIENASDGKYQERTGGHQEMNQKEPSSSKNTESINPLPPTPFQKTQAKALVTEADDIGQAVTVVEPVPSSESLRPQKQTMAKEHVRPDGSVSQDGLMCLNRSGQEELIENTTVSHLRHHGSQQKPPNATTTCHVITLKCQPTGCEAGLESGATRPALQAGTDQHSSAAVCGGQVLHGNISPLPNNNCKIPKKVTPPAAACGADIVDGRMVSSEMLRRSTHTDRGSSGAEPLDSSQDITPGESPGRVESDHTEKQLSIQVERAAHVSSESPTEGLMGEEEEEEEGGSLAERARPRGGGGTPGPPDSAGRGLKLRQGAGERKHRRVQGQRSRGALGERGVTTKESLLQQGKLASDGGCTHISPLTAREKREANDEIMESCTHSWLPEEPPQHLSQIQFGVSASRPQMLLQGFSSTSNDRDSPALLLGPPQSELEPSQFSRHCESAVACDQQTQTLQTNPQRCLARTQNDFRQIDVGHQTQPPIHNVYLQNQQTASLALSGPSLSQISTADNHNTLTSYSKSICPTEAHRTQSLSPGIKPSTSTCSHSVKVYKVIDHSGRSGDYGLATCATGPLETAVHPLTPWTSPTYPQPGGDHRDGGGQQTHGLIMSHTGSPVTTLQGHTSHIGSPVTTLQGHTSHIGSPVTTLQGHTSHIVSPITTLHGHTSHIVSPVTTLQGNTSHIVSPVTTLQGHTSHIVSPVTTLQGHTSHIVSPVTTLQGHTSHIVSPVTTLQGHASHIVSPVTTLQGHTSHIVSPVTTLQGPQLPECQLSGTVRPVLSSQDYPDESSSSSDDEGKLIIEL